MGRPGLQRLAAVLAVLALLGGLAGFVPAAGAPPRPAGTLGHAARASCPRPPSPAATPPAWRPGMRAAIAYAHLRRGDISFAVRVEHRFWGYRAEDTVPSASVLKAMLMTAYLNRASVRDRPLNAADRALLEPMIRWSDNTAATDVRNIVGDASLVALARRVGMRRFSPAPIWGLSQIDADDQTRFWLHIDRYIAPLHRAYALRLLATIVSWQRWGVARVAPAGWQLYFKGGWGSGTGAVDHQVALLTRGPDRVALAIMTLDDGTHLYGQQTLQGLAQRLLAGLACTTPPNARAAGRG